MTGAQLLHDLRTSLETSAERLPAGSAERRRRLHQLEDRSLWSGRKRRLA